MHAGDGRAIDLIRTRSLPSWMQGPNRPGTAAAPDPASPLFSEGAAFLRRRSPCLVGAVAQGRGEPFEGAGGPLGDGAVAESGELRGVSRAGGAGDPAARQVLRPLREPGVQAPRAAHRARERCSRRRAIPGRTGAERTPMHTIG